MSTIEIVKKAYVAWESKDIETLRTVLHEDYIGKMPGGMEIVGIEGAKQCVENCPFDAHSENETYITEGDQVVRIWDFVVKAPNPFRMRMAELSVVKDGKIILNEAYFDTSSFPKEVQEMCEESKKKFQEKQPATSGKGKQ